MAMVLFRDFNFVLEDMLVEFEIIKDKIQANTLGAWIYVDYKCKDAILNVFDRLSPKQQKINTINVNDMGRQMRNQSSHTILKQETSNLISQLMLKGIRFQQTIWKIKKNFEEVKQANGAG